MSTLLIQNCARDGERLPSGTLPFKPPLILTDIHALIGTGRTTLVPSGTCSGALIRLENMPPGDLADSGLPRRVTLRGFRIQGPGAGAQNYGLQINGGLIRCEDVEIVHCYHGLDLEWAVDVAFRDCVFAKNACNVYCSPSLGVNSITTVRFSGCQIRESTVYGCLVQNGLGITFDQRTIIESNANIGLCVAPHGEGRIQDVQCRDVWFENNGQNWCTGTERYVRFDNCETH